MQSSSDSPVQRALVRAGVLLGLIAVVVGLRAGSPVDASGTRWHLRDLLHGVGTGLQIALGLWVLVVLVFVAVSRGGMQSLPPRTRKSPVRAVAVLLLLALGAMLRSLLYHHQIHHRPPLPKHINLTLLKPTPEPALSPAPAAPEHALPVTHGHVNWALLVVLGVLATALGVLARRRRRPPALPVEEPVVLDPLADGLAAAATSLRETAGGDPRERVVSAYAAFEAVLGEQGVARGASGTPELLLRKAVEAGAPAASAADLTTLFGLARFGIEEITDDDVTRAERALDELMAVR